MNLGSLCLAGNNDLLLRREEHRPALRIDDGRCSGVKRIHVDDRQVVVVGVAGRSGGDDRSAIGFFIIACCLGRLYIAFFGSVARERGRHLVGPCRRGRRQNERIHAVAVGRRRRTCRIVVFRRDRRTGDGFTILVEDASAHDGRKRCLGGKHVENDTPNRRKRPTAGLKIRWSVPGIVTPLPSHVEMDVERVVRISVAVGDNCMAGGVTIRAFRNTHDHGPLGVKVGEDVRLEQSEIEACAFVFVNRVGISEHVREANGQVSGERATALGLVVHAHRHANVVRKLAGTDGVSLGIRRVLWIKWHVAPVVDAALHRQIGIDAVDRASEGLRRHRRRRPLEVAHRLRTGSRHATTISAGRVVVVVLVAFRGRLSPLRLHERIHAEVRRIGHAGAETWARGRRGGGAKATPARGVAGCARRRSRLFHGNAVARGIRSVRSRGKTVGERGGVG